MATPRTREPPGTPGARARTGKAAASRPAEAPPRSPAAPPPPKEGPPPWTGERLGTFFAQNKILGGAAEAFRKKGVQEATIEDILVAAGVSRRTFYKAFANKEDVVVALHRELSELFLAAMRDAVRSATTPLERISRCVDVYLLAAQRSSGLMMALMAEAQRPGRLAERRRAALAGVAGLLEEGSRASGREPPDPLLVIGLLTGLESVARALMEEGRLGDADIARARAAMLRLAIGTLAEPDDVVPPLPRARGRALERA